MSEIVHKYYREPGTRERLVYCTGTRAWLIADGVVWQWHRVTCEACRDRRLVERAPAAPVERGSR